MEQKTEVTMEPHSGVIVFDFLDRGNPVIGWVSERTEDGAVLVYPVILDAGCLAVRREGNLRYQVVGMTRQWVELVNAHNAKIAYEAPVPGVALAGERDAS